MTSVRSQISKDERRSDILDAAVEEFFQKGFAAARMDDIAKRASVSKGTVYLYFDSKEELFQSIIEAFAIPNVEKVEALIQAAPEGIEGIRSLAQLAPHIIRNSRIPKLMKIVVADSAAFPELVRKYRTNVIDRVFSVVSKALRDAHESGKAEIPDPELIAKLVIAPFAFSSLWAIVFEADDKKEVDLESLFETHSKILERALAIST